MKISSLTLQSYFCNNIARVSELVVRRYGALSIGTLSLSLSLFKLNLMIQPRIYYNYFFLSHCQHFLGALKKNLHTNADDNNSVPAEMYKYGTQYWACAISGIIVSDTINYSTLHTANKNETCWN